MVEWSRLVWPLRSLQHIPGIDSDRHGSSCSDIYRPARATVGTSLGIPMKLTIRRATLASESADPLGRGV